MQCTKQFSFDSSKCSAYVLPIWYLDRSKHVLFK
jgi:hypothetical protein